MQYNFELQYYKGLPLRLVDRKDYKEKLAKRYLINDTNQNIWIPNRHLEEDGTIKEGENLEYILLRALSQISLAGLELHFRAKGFRKPDYENVNIRSQPYETFDL